MDGTCVSTGEVQKGLLDSPGGHWLSEGHGQDDDADHDDDGGHHDRQDGYQAGQEGAVDFLPVFVFFGGVVLERDGHDVGASGVAGDDGVAADAVDDALQSAVVLDGAAPIPQEPLGVAQESALARPRVLRQGDPVQQGVVDQQPPQGEGNKSVVGQCQHLQLRQRGERVWMDERQPVVVQVQLLQRDQAGQLATVEFSQLVVLEMEHQQFTESVQSLVADERDVAAVEVQVGEVLPPDERLSRDVSQSVAVQVHGGGVHGDELGDTLVIATAALDDVGRPGLIVEALAAVRALHATVAGVEVAAHAQGEAVNLVTAQEFAGPDLGYGQAQLRRIVVVDDDDALAVLLVSVVEAAHQVGVVAHIRKVTETEQIKKLGLFGRKHFFLGRMGGKKCIFCGRIFPFGENKCAGIRASRISLRKEK